MKITYPMISKVLPLVYDDSLSYYEVVCKVKEKLNEVIDLDNAQSDAINELGEASAERYNQFEQRILRDLASMKAELEEDIASGDNDVMEQLSGLIASLSDEVDGLSDGVADAVATAHAASDEVTALSETVSGFDSRIQTVEANLSDVESDVDDVKDDVTALDNRVTSVEGTVSGHTSDIASLDGRVDDLEDAMQGLVFADVDSQLSGSSTNPVENQVITGALEQLDEKVDELTIRDLTDVDLTGASAGQVLGIDNNGDIVPVNQSGGSTINVVDNLNSQSTTDALSANQGRVLANAGTQLRSDMNQLNIGLNTLNSNIQIHEIFQRYDLADKITNIGTNAQTGATQIVETYSDGVATTDFTVDSQTGTRTITTSIVMNSGDYDYTKTVVINSAGTQITESYSVVPK